MSESRSPVLTEHIHRLRVRYQETDAQGHAHHATYLNWFEVGRIELLRACGLSYRHLEETGVMLVVIEASCQYHTPVRYDDLIEITTRVLRSRGTRIRHGYEINCDERLVARGETTIASVNRDGRVVRLPDWLQIRDSEL